VATSDSANVALLASYMASSFVQPSVDSGGTLAAEPTPVSTQTGLLTQPYARG
jgi:hypothetical protein